MYMGWWRGFLRQHEDKLVTKQGDKFGSEQEQLDNLT